MFLERRSTGTTENPLQAGKQHRKTQSYLRCSQMCFQIAFIFTTDLKISLNELKVRFKASPARFCGNVFQVFSRSAPAEERNASLFGAANQKEGRDDTDQSRRWLHLQR